LLLACVVNEKPVVGFFILAAFLIATHFFTDFNVIEFAKNNTKEIIFGLIVYLPIGLVWSYFRWYLKIKDAKRKLLDDKSSFYDISLKNARRAWVNSRARLSADEVGNDKGYSNLDSLTIQRLSDKDLLKYVDSDNTEINKSVDEDWAKHVKSHRPFARNYKTSIVNWIAWWPFSMFWLLVDDFARWCGTQIYNIVGGSFQKMSDKEFEKI